jgi:hypothetical protein
MGDARRKRALATAVQQASHAMRRLAEAASAHVGSDCYTHAEIGRILLADLGFSFELRVGAAAWRIGSGDGDVVSHIPQIQGHLPPGARGFAYHAWLEAGDWLVDLTTYHLRRKAADLDALDGGSTNVDWCPDFLLWHRSQVSTYSHVAKAPSAGVAYYEVIPQLAEFMADGFILDAEDVATARLIMSNPNMRVLGPNMMS